jgi:hypothetical protein
MKGQTKISLNGKDIELKFTLGVLEDFQDYCEEHELDSDVALGKMKHLRQFLHLMTGGRVDAEAFKDLEFSEIEKFNAIVSQATGELGNAPKGAKK